MAAHKLEKNGWKFECDSANMFNFVGTKIRVWAACEDWQAGPYLNYFVTLQVDGAQTRDSILGKMQGMCGGKTLYPAFNAPNNPNRYPCDDCTIGECKCNQWKINNTLDDIAVSGGATAAPTATDGSWLISTEKPATQSSTNYGGEPGLATDGDTEATGWASR